MDEENRNYGNEMANVPEPITNANVDESKSFSLGTGGTAAISGLALIGAGTILVKGFKGAKKLIGYIRKGIADDKAGVAAHTTATVDGKPVDAEVVNDKENNSSNEKKTTNNAKRRTK